MNPASADLEETLKRPSSKMNSRCARIGQHDFNVAPGHPASPPRSQAFHDGFLGRKSSRIAQKPRASFLTVRDLVGSKDAIAKPLASAREHLFDPTNFNYVDSYRDYH